MSKVEIQTKQFIDDNGISTPYKRLVIIGHLDGIEHSLEIKLTKNEMVLAEALLRSGNLEVTTKNGGSGVKVTDNHKSFIWRGGR